MNIPILIDQASDEKLIEIVQDAGYAISDSMAKARKSIIDSQINLAAAQERYDKAIANYNELVAMIDSVIAFLNKYNLDSGVDWKYEYESRYKNTFEAEEIQNTRLPDSRRWGEKPQGVTQWPRFD